MRQHMILHDPWVCTIITMCVHPLVRPPIFPSVCFQLVKIIITLEPHGVFFITFLHTYVCQQSLTTGMRTHLFLMDMGLRCYCPAFCGLLVKILKTPEPYERLIIMGY